MKLPRPYIPLEVRLMVAERQVREHQLDPHLSPSLPKQARLEALLRILSTYHDEGKLELHHRPALLNREQVKIAGVVIGYLPDANDHRYLVYLPEDEHDIETRVRGQGAQLSDLAQARKNKRIARRLSGTKKRGPKLRSASRWPPKGSRKINWKTQNEKHRT